MAVMYVVWAVIWCASSRVGLMCQVGQWCDKHRHGAICRAISCVRRRGNTKEVGSMWCGSVMCQLGTVWFTKVVWCYRLVLWFLCLRRGLMPDLGVLFVERIWLMVLQYMQHLGWCHMSDWGLVYIIGQMVVWYVGSVFICQAGWW